MKAIILAAGEGTRLRPFTEDRPKCMVQFQGKPIIDSILETMILLRFKNIILITGYQNEVLQEHITKQYTDIPIKFYHNPKYNQTNMVSTLFCTEKELDDDIIISYSDIIYKKEILKNLMKSQDDVTVVIDKEWRKLWELRMDDPLEDAETLKLDSEGNILEIGKKPRSYKDIEGQYIGLIKISRNKIREIIAFYNGLNKEEVYDGKDFQNMYMTTFIQLLIDNDFKISTLPINGGWVEIDTINDLRKLGKHKI